MADRRGRLAAARLYLCTGLRDDLGEFTRTVCSAGVDLVQLREKGLDAGEELRQLGVLAGAAASSGALWSVNDRADLAFAADADILHLGQDDLPVGAARRLLGPDVLVGLSTHSPEQVDAAAADDDVDYFCVGPVWETPTKPGRSAAGLDLLRYAAALGTDKPWFAIGGIHLGNLDEVLETGARRIVVVRVLTGASEPAATAAELAGRLAAA